MVWDNSWIENRVSGEFKLPNFTLENTGLLKSGQKMPVSTATKNKPVKYYIVSPDEDETLENITRTISLMRYSYTVIKSLDELPEIPPEALIGVLINDGNLDNIGNIDRLFEYMKAKKDTVFLKLFDTSSEIFYDYHKRLGIESYGGSYPQRGVDFLEKVLLSGLYFKAEINCKANEIKISGKSRFYAVGYDPQYPKFHDRNPLIWRTFYEGGAIYCFNNDLLKDFKNCGILTGILSTDKEVYVYPVVNAGIQLINAMPYYTDENSDKLTLTYNRDALLFQRDIIWSDLVSIVRGLGTKYTFYPYAGTNQDRMENELLEYYGKQLRLMEGEWGFYESGRLAKMFPKYSASSEYKYEGFGTNNRIMDAANAFGYIGGNKVALPVTMHGALQDKGTIFQAYSLASSFGYVSHMLDLQEVFSDTSGEDIWTDYKLDYVQGFYPVTKLYEFYDFVTASQAAIKMSVFLNSNPDIRYEKAITDTGTEIITSITFGAQNIGETSYILKCKADVVSSSNCKYTRISQGVYLVVVEDGKEGRLTTKEMR